MCRFMIIDISKITTVNFSPREIIPPRKIKIIDSTVYEIPEEYDINSWKSTIAKINSDGTIIPQRGYSYTNNEYAKAAFITFELINKRQFVEYIDITVANINEVEMKIASILSKMSTHSMYTTINYIIGTIINSDLNDIL